MVGAVDAVERPFPDVFDHADDLHCAAVVVVGA